MLFKTMLTKTIATRSTQIVVSLLTAAGIGLALPQAATAQTSGADALQDNAQSGDSFYSDPLSSQGSGQTNSVMNLIQRALFAPSMSDEQFVQQQRETIGSEASDFRARQIELLQQQQTQTPTQTTPPASDGN